MRNSLRVENVVKNDRIEELEGMVHKIINEKIQDEKVKNDRIAELEGWCKKMPAQIEANITNMHKMSQSCTLKSAALHKAEYVEQNAQQPLEKPVNVQTDGDPRSDPILQSDAVKTDMEPPRVF